MNGTDWAYERLVAKARNGDRHQTRELAKIFRKEVLNECVGMACCDIDWESSKYKDAYVIVRDVCIELTK